MQEAIPQDVTPAVRALAQLVGAPDFVLPWLDRFYDQADAGLLLAAGDGSLAGASDERLARAVRRAVLDVDDAGAHAPAGFHERLEIWAMFEGWKDVPLAIHRRLADWEVADYAEKIRGDGRPEFEAALCRGCGLCATGCSADAIGLLPLAERGA